MHDVRAEVTGSHLIRAKRFSFSALNVNELVIFNSCKTQTGLHGNAWLPCSPSLGLATILLSKVYTAFYMELLCYSRLVVVKNE